jgi:hypothetical protein
MESHKFNITKYRRWQATTEYNYIQLVVEKPDIPSQESKQILKTVKEKCLKQ